jgi:hypothetical protein
MDVRDYVEGLTLAPGPDPLLLPWRPEGLRGAKTAAGPSWQMTPGVIDAGAILTFDGEVTPQQREDVLFSVQLAQRAASGEFNRHHETEAWYVRYSQVLEGVGWVPSQSAIVKQEEDSGEMRMDRRALTLLMAVATQNMLGVLTQAIGALEGLADKDGRITLFENFASKEGSSSFQLGAVSPEDGQLALAMGAFHFKAADRRRKILLFSSGAQGSRFWSSAQKYILNEPYYARAREAVLVKLGNPADFIAGLGKIG